MKHVFLNLIHESKVAGIETTITKLKLLFLVNIIGSTSLIIILIDTFYKYMHSQPITLVNFISLTIASILSCILPLYHLYIKFRILGLRQRIDSELPYFLVLASIADSVGIPLYDYLISEQILTCFKGIGVESKKLKELLNINPNPIEALATLSNFTPSKNFSKFTKGYIRVLSEGGDIKLFYDIQISEAYHDLTRKYSQWSKLVAIIVEAFLIIGFSTTIIVAIAWLMGFTVIEILYMQAYLFIPLMTITSIVLIHTLKPSSEFLSVPEVKAIIKNILITTLMASVFFFILKGYYILKLSELYMLTMSIGLLTFGIINYIVIHKPYKDVDEHVISILRKLLDHSKIGHAIDIMLLNNPLQTNSKVLTRTLNEIIARLRHGGRLYTYAKSLKNFRLKYLILLLDIVVLSGSLMTGIIEKVIDYLIEIKKIKKETLSNLKLYEILSIAFPPLFFLLSLILTSALSNFFETLTTYSIGSLTLVTAYQLNVHELSLTLLSVFSILSISLTLVVAKAIDNTILLTHRAGVVLLLNMLVYKFYSIFSSTLLPDLIG